MTKKEQAIKNLKDFARATYELGIPFMLMEGTLLGAHREKDFIINDEKDIDLGIHDKHFDRYEPLMIRLNDFGFSMTKLVRIGDEIHGGAFVRGANHIDVMRMVPVKDCIINYGLMGKLYYTYTKDVFDGYDQIEFQGNIYKTPKLIEKFLTQRYGDWKIPVPLNKYSWRDKKYSPNVRWVKDEPLESI